MAPWIVPTTISCGVRTNLRVVRLATAKVAVAGAVTGAHSFVVGTSGCLFPRRGPHPPSSPAPGPSVAFGEQRRRWPAPSRRRSCKGEEDFVERRPPEADVVDTDGRGLERARRGRELLRSGTDGERYPAGCAIDE